MDSSKANSLWPEDGAVFAASSVELDVSLDVHPICENHGDEIARNWEREVAAQPALFDGEVVMHRDLTLDAAGRLTGVAHLVPFSAFLWWRKQYPRPDCAEHLFPVAVPLTSDGAVLAVRMGSHTANAGRVYCAAGSLDAHDLTDGKIDLEKNILREVAEETGFDLRQARTKGGFAAVRVKRSVTLFRIYQLDFDAEEACRRVLAHMEKDEEKEIAGPVIIRNGDLDAHDYAAFMAPILKLIFGPESSLIGKA